MLLAAAAWWADRHGAHSLALDALLLAVPFAALAGLAEVARSYGFDVG